MIRFLGGSMLTAIVLVLGLGILGCGEATSPSPKSPPQDRAKMQEEMEKQKDVMKKAQDQMKEKMKDKAPPDGGAPETPDKDKPKEGAKDKE